MNKKHCKTHLLSDITYTVCQKNKQKQAKIQEINWKLLTAGKMICPCSKIFLLHILLSVQIYLMFKILKQVKEKSKKNLKKILGARWLCGEHCWRFLKVYKKVPCSTFLCGFLLSLWVSSGLLPQSWHVSVNWWV